MWRFAALNSNNSPAQHSSGCQTKFLRLAVVLALVFAQCFAMASSAGANPIYVYRGPGGVVRFSSQPPQDGSPAEVWTAKNAKFSVINSRASRAKRVRPNWKMYGEQIKIAALHHSVEESLIRAVIHAESAFDRYAVSPKGARGLMQLMPDTARRFGVSNTFDPNQNIMGGTRYLAFLLNRFNDNLQLAIAAYNAGEGAVDQYSGVPPFAETKQYVTKVMSLKRHYERVG